MATSPLPANNAAHDNRKRDFSQCATAIAEPPSGLVLLRDAIHRTMNHVATAGGRITPKTAVNHAETRKTRGKFKET